jgi:UDP-N-acetylglucosamine/UDP-N-acetylgalactosamine diphosphorylase
VPREIKHVTWCREGVLDDMAAEGVECVDCISVDNALVRIGDPLFVGYCHERAAQCGMH